MRVTESAIRRIEARWGCAINRRQVVLNGWEIVPEDPTPPGRWSSTGASGDERVTREREADSDSGFGWRDP